MKEKNIQLLKVDFEEIITLSELPLFRGVMIGLSDNHPLFHNHADNGFRYSYPMIQYKLIDGRPSVLGINDGADALASLIAGRREIQCNLGRRELELHVSSMVGWHDEISLSEIRHTYRIEDWLPLNADNFRDFSRARGIIEKLSILQRVLRGNILSFAKGMDIFFDTMADCTINDIDCTGYTRFKGVELMSFSGFFSSNVRMPQWIGLGKSASLNHGTIIRI